MPASHEARLAFACSDAAEASAAAAALQVEARESPDGAGVRVAIEGTQLVVHIAAADVSSLRSALNSVVRLADAALRSLRT